MVVRLTRAALFALVLLFASPAIAGDNDIALSRLGRILRDNAGMPTRAIGISEEWRSLASQLGVVLAPRLAAPADTIGFGGFAVSADLGRTTIANTAGYWRARVGSPDPGGAAGMAHGPSALSTVGVSARKGMWFAPVPSLEVGVGMVHLLESGLWSGQLTAKVALHEGYHELPVPSVAVRGGVARVFGETDMDLTIASVDVSASKHVGIGGTWSMDPYVGWNALFIVPRTEVIDPTPDVDPLVPANQADGDLNFVFRNQDAILRHRFFAGAKAKFYVFELTVEGSFALAGASLDDRAGTNEPCSAESITERCDSKDQAKSQTTLLGSLGMDF